MASLTAPVLFMWLSTLDLLVTTLAHAVLLSNLILSHHCCSYSIPTHTFLSTSTFFLLKSDLMEVNRNSQTDLCTPQTIQLRAFNEALRTAIPAQSTGEQLNGGKGK